MPPKFDKDRLLDTENGTWLEIRNYSDLDVLLQVRLNGKWDITYLKKGVYWGSTIYEGIILPWDSKSTIICSIFHGKTLVLLKIFN